MPDVIDHLKIMNNALSRIAAGSIMAEDEDTDLAAQTVPVYYDRLDAVLAMYGWTFAGKTYKLDRVGETVENGYVTADTKFMNGWRYGFALPGNRVGEPRRVLDNPRRPDYPFRDFLIEGGNLYADRDELWATVTVRPDPIVWRPDFRLALTCLVAADLCIPVTHDQRLAEALFQQGEGSPSEQGRGGLIGRAIAADAASAPAKAPLHNTPLTDARFM
ncbi:hypothetical protein [Tardiphaga sp.]|jgi:hypothetical protein|uniref:hypothetical protein n=1 Tax=Tardiphaga sp. TaxID=1926292 RepID=UPI0037DA0FF0